VHSIDLLNNNNNNIKTATTWGHANSATRDSSFSDTKDLCEIPMGSPPTGLRNAGGVH